MTLNKEEFKTLVMLYAANIDGNIKSEEVKVMLERCGFDTVEKMEKLFAKMSDAEALAVIRENKPLYVSTEGDRLDLFADLCAIIEADEKCTPIEEQMVRTLRRMLN
jgi:tellurite resistance protein